MTSLRRSYLIIFTGDITSAGQAKLFGTLMSKDEQVPSKDPIFSPARTPIDPNKLSAALVCSK